MLTTLLNIGGWSNVDFPTDPITLPVPVTGSTARMQVRTAAGELVIDIANATTPAPGIQYLDASAGTVRLAIGPLDMMAAYRAAAPKAGQAATLFYDLIVTDADGLKQARLEGTFTVLPGVTLAGAYGWANAPFAEDEGVDLTDLMPSSLKSVAYRRWNEHWLTVRIKRSTSPLVEEMTLRDPDGHAGVNAGWKLYAWRVLFGGEWVPILKQPLDQGSSTALEWAFRLGVVADTYPTDYLAPEINGEGHGNQTVPTGGVTILSDSVPGVNLQTTWDPDETILGTEIQITAPYDLALHSTATVAARIDFTRLLNAQYGSEEICVLTPEVANLCMQDSPTAMHAVSVGGRWNRAKLEGAAAATLTGSGTQLGNWRVPQTGARLQFYNDADDRLIPTLWSTKGPFIQNAAETLTPGQYCNFGYAHVTDHALLPKMAGYAASSQQVGPFTTTPLNEQHTFHNRRGCEFREAGPL